MRILNATLLLAFFALLFSGCKNEKAAGEDWRAMPSPVSVKTGGEEKILDLPGTNRYLLMGKKLGLPKYAAFYSRPGEDPASIIPVIIAIGERQFFSGEMYADTNNVGRFKTPSVFHGTYISKHGYASRAAFESLRLPGENVNVTIWHNQSAIREANIRRWNDILSYHDDKYRERMAKAFRTTNTQTDEVWDDDVDLTVRIRYIIDGYTYMFYNSGNTAASAEEIKPVDVFRPLTAEIETRENPTNSAFCDVMLYFRYDGGKRYYMYKRDYDLEPCYWRQSEHVTLQNDPSKVEAKLELIKDGEAVQSETRSLGDFVKGYFPYATFTNWVTGVSLETPPKGAKLRITVDGGPLYGPLEAEKEF
ncbi:hypothetical protein IKZ40_07445 [bacterium]|nr:hypothetical protein [bacterium]